MEQKKNKYESTSDCKGRNQIKKREEKACYVWFLNQNPKLIHEKKKSNQKKGKELTEDMVKERWGLERINTRKNSRKRDFTLLIGEVLDASARVVGVGVDWTGLEEETEMAGFTRNRSTCERGRNWKGGRICFKAVIITQIPFLEKLMSLDSEPSFNWLVLTVGHLLFGIFIFLLFRNHKNWSF